MDGILCFLSNGQQLWDPYTLPASSDIHVTEVWGGDGPELRGIVQKEVQAAGVVGWLDTSRSIAQRADAGDPSTLSFRIVWARRDPFAKRNDIARPTLLRVMQSFRLETAFGYYTAQINGATCLPGEIRPPPTTPARCPKLRRYLVTASPKLAALWSQDTPTGTAQAILFAESRQIFKMKELLRSAAALLTHPLGLLLLFLLLLSGEAERY